MKKIPYGLADFKRINGWGESNPKKG